MRQRIYTDGACTNDRFGGWSAIFYTHKGVVIYGGNGSETTNNRMELRAIIEALKRIVDYDTWYFGRYNKYPDVKYEIFSDSAYCINCICNRWYVEWRNNHWRNAKGDEIKNPDMWDECGTLIEYVQDAGIPVRFFKVKGHSGNPQNDLADMVARSESLKAKMGLG